MAAALIKTRQSNFIERTTCKDNLQDAPANAIANEHGDPIDVRRKKVDDLATLEQITKEIEDKTGGKK